MHSQQCGATTGASCTTSCPVCMQQWPCKGGHVSHEHASPAMHERVAHPRADVHAERAVDPRHVPADKLRQLVRVHGPDDGGGGQRLQRPPPRSVRDELPLPAPHKCPPDTAGDHHEALVSRPMHVDHGCAVRPLNVCLHIAHTCNLHDERKSLSGCLKCSWDGRGRSWCSGPISIASSTCMRPAIEHR